jgi:predicted ATPase
LILLVERAGEVVGKKELISRAWPDITVDESNLRVHVAGLRKALGDGRSGTRYVTNIPSRGYCFVAPITRPVAPNVASVAEPPVSDRAHRLPLRLMRMVGRDATVRMISEQLAAQRFVTIHGPGGIGKTTVAVSVGHAQLAAFEGAVRFVDLGPLNDPRLVPGAVASALGLPVQSSDPTPGLIGYLRDRRMLLILDSCEHVIEAAAALAERIFQEAPRMHVLATSRESLRVEGEHVHRLSALESPPEGVELTAAQVLAFPAVHLFVERAAASGHRFELTDQEAPIVAEICSRLDGIALAIELAAGRVGAHGLRETAALLDNRFRLLWHGRRTALPRHQTLSATLDWSYDLLTEIERAVLRRLSVFMGSFALEAAQAVAVGDDLDGPQVLDAIGQLVAKSLVSTNAGGPALRYRLLDSTRGYAYFKLADSGEGEPAARRHAVYYREFLEHTDTGHDGRAAFAEHLGNVRAALEWSFSGRGDVALGTALAAASAPLFIELSLLSECHHWAERALSVMDETTRGQRCEMELQAALGLALMFTIGNSEQSHAALTRGLEIAEQLDDRPNQFRLISRLHMYHRRVGNFDRMLACARRCEAVAKEIADPVAIAAAHSLVGVSHHLIGNQAEARNHLEAALVRLPESRHTNYFGFYLQRSRIALARTLWLLGCPDQAVRVVRQTVDDAINDPEAVEPVTFCIVFIWGVSVFRWTGDLAAAEECITRLTAHAERHALMPYLAVAFSLQGEMLIKRGEVETGMNLLRRSLSTLRADRYGLYTTELNSALAGGFAMTGRLDEALVTVDETIALVERNGDLLMPELLRIRGEILEQAADERRAEEAFLRSIELAGRQSALSWRLRASMSLARLRCRQGRREEAREALAETYALFSEGFDTDDLMAAKRLLDDQREPS